MSEKQPLVKAGKLPKEEMVNIINYLDRNVCGHMFIMAELLDWQPSKRIEGYKLPSDANSVLYREWEWSKEWFTISKADEIPIRWRTKDGKINKETAEQLGAPVDAYVWSDRKSALEEYDGLSSISWFLDYDENGVSAHSHKGSLWDRSSPGSNVGVLLGSRVSTEEMVKGFDPSTILRNLESDLNVIKQKHTNLSTQITHIEERIAKFREIKSVA